MVDYEGLNETDNYVSSVETLKEIANHLNVSMVGEMSDVEHEICNSLVRAGYGKWTNHPFLHTFCAYD